MTNNKNIVFTPMYIVEKIIKIMDYGGSNPKNRSFKMNFISGTILFFFVAFMLLNICYIYGHEYATLGDELYDVLVIVSCWQTAMKHAMLFKNMKMLRKLIDEIKYRYWSIGDFLTNDENIIIQQRYKFLFHLNKAYYLSFLIIYSCLCIFTLLQGYLVLNLWAPGTLITLIYQVPYYYCVFVFQVTFTSLEAFTVLVPYDDLFFAFIGVSLIELTKLKYKLNKIGNEDEKSQNYTMAECVKHHAMLLQFLSDVEDVFSPGILWMLGTNMMLGVITLFGFMVEDNNYHKFLFASINGLATSQFFLYCLLGQIVKDQTLDVADAAYYCQWENTKNYPVRRGIVNVIQRSHKFASISMGGLLVLNLDNFTNVAQMVMSIFTLFLNTRNL